MGTRAVIRFGRTRIATHWDGDPQSLGKDLEQLGLNPTLQQVIDVAKKHGIDFATKEVRDLTADDRFKAIAAKTNGKYTWQRLKEMFEKERKMIAFGIQGPEDYPIETFKGYNDFAKYEYDLREHGVFYRQLSGEYSPNNKAKWGPLKNFALN